MMQGDSKALIATRRADCVICGASLARLIELPALPLTDSFCREPVANPIPGIDQHFLYCGDCGHGQLEAQVYPKVLYGSNYFFRTSTSATARKGTEHFVSVLGRLAGDRRFRCVLDVGCNDLFLLKQLSGRAAHRVGIDPVWRGREDERDDQDILLFGADVEDLDLGSLLPEAPDLVVSRHTLEHIGDPAAIMRTLLEICSDDALILFEVPALEPLVNRCRFDQVFHQHLHYFSLPSFQRLIADNDGRFLGHWENYHDWGALVVALEKGPAVAADFAPVPFSPVDIADRFDMFRNQMRTTAQLLERLDGSKFGYGAAQMLPVLAYHLGTDLSCLESVIDDDPEKDGLQYWNLPVTVTGRPSPETFAGASILITAVDNVQPIMTRLLSDRPRHILYPFNLI